MIASYDLFTAGYSDASGAEFDRQLIEKLKAMPGVESVALANRVPLAFGGGSTSVKPEGYVLQPNESMETQVALITPNYFQTLQIPIVKGRDFTAADTKSSQRVTIVSQAFANRYWPNQEALGKQMESDLTHERFTVVGVARDYKVNSLSEKPMPFLYLPHYQVYRPGMMMVVRTTGDPMTFSKAAQNAIHEMNADLVVYRCDHTRSARPDFEFPAADCGDVCGRIRVARADSGRGGNLRSDGLYDAATHPRNRNPHDAGCEQARYSETGAGARASLDVHWCGAGAGGGVCADALFEDFAAGGNEHRCGDVYVAWRCCCARWRFLPASFRRGARCAWIRWLRCDTSERRFTFRLRTSDTAAGLGVTRDSYVV